MKKIVLVFSILFSFGPLSSQVIYTDINPDSTINSWAAMTFHLSKIQAGYGDTGTFDIWFHPFSPNEVQLTTRTNCQVMVNGSNLPLALSAGDSISSNKSWFTATYVNLNKGNTQGLWLGGVVDKFVGIRFKKTPTGSWLYGWVRLDIDATPTFYRAKDYAYNSTSNATSILAGEGMASGVSEQQGKVLTIYPNPSQDGKFRIDSEIPSEKLKIEVLNLLGEVMYAANGTNTIDISAMPKGIYLLKINGTTRKLLHQ